MADITTCSVLLTVTWHAVWEPSYEDARVVSNPEAGPLERPSLRTKSFLASSTLKL